MNIKKFSQITGLSSHTLRYYEKVGLIEVPRDSKGHRNFSADDLRWVECLKRLKKSSMPLREIKKFASMRHTCGGQGCQRLKVLEDHQARLDQERQALLIRLEKIEAEINMFKDWNNIP